MERQIDRKPGAFQEIEILRWWTRVGVIHPLDDSPQDRFGADPASDQVEHSDTNDPKRRYARATSEIKAAAVQRVGSAVLDTTEVSARTLAREAKDLETLRSVVEGFDGCALKRTAIQLVFADGVPTSRVMFVGEAPGADEDRIGRPFVGRAGKLLDCMLGTIGLDRQSIYIANVVPWRPPGNRTPTPQETQACLPFIERQIELADPEFLVCLGSSAARTLLGVQGIMRARGTWLPYALPSGRTIRALAMLHPAFLLRQSGHKKFAWSDLRALAAELELQPISIR